jgi:phage tail-like protein
MPTLNLHPAFYFKVKILGGSGGATDESFQEVSGLTMEIQTEDVRSGGENDIVYKLPSKVQYPNLTLKRALIAPNSELLTWCKTTLQGGFFNIQLKDIQISLLDPTTDAIPIEWKLTKAYPIKYEVSSLGADKNEFMMETIELAYQKFEVL